MSLDPSRAIPEDLRAWLRWCDQQTTQGFLRADVTADYTVEDRITVVKADDTGGAITITLPPAANNEDRHLHVKKVGNTASVTIDADGSETIDGATTLILTTQYESAHLYCDGAEWLVL